MMTQESGKIRASWLIKTGDLIDKLSKYKNNLGEYYGYYLLRVLSGKKIEIKCDDRRIIFEEWRVGL